MTGQEHDARGHDGGGLNPVSCVFGLEQVEALPPEDRQAVREFVAFVLERRRQRAEREIRRLE